MQKRTTKISKNHVNLINLYKTNKKQEATTTNKTADIMFISITVLESPVPNFGSSSSEASYKKRQIEKSMQN